MQPDEIVKVWKEVFPNSKISPSKAALGGEGHYFKCYLAANKQECINGYFENDPLNYMFSIDERGYKEHSHSLSIKPPENSYLAYGRAKIRAKSMKEPTLEKIKKRFLQIKKLVEENKENLINLCFDINEKL